MANFDEDDSEGIGREAYTGREDTIQQCLDIAQEYEEQDLKLTLRQMYYQLVARGLSPNGQKAYKRLGSILTEARYTGAFPVDALEDRGRTVHRGAFELDKRDLSDALAESATMIRDLPYYHLGTDRWLGQPVHVSVWVEKEALAGVFEPVCDDLGVSWLACKGYPSVSALHTYLMEVVDAQERGAQQALILYFGDHDPDGWEIPRGALRGIERLAALREYEGHDATIPIDLQRVALNMSQIRRFNPPPFPAKISSARYNGYVKEHGTDDAWELDALDPTTLRDLIRTGVEGQFDDDIARTHGSQVADVRRRLVETITDPSWLAGVWKS